jgi:hypothetical protein
MTWRFEMTSNIGERQRANRRLAKRVNAEEAAQMLERTRRTICRWELEGLMPPKAYLPHERIRLYRRADIEEMAHKRQVARLTKQDTKNG